MDGQILIRDKAKSDCVTKWFTLTKKRRIRHDPVEMTIPTFFRKPPSNQTCMEKTALNEDFL